MAKDTRPIIERIDARDPYFQHRLIGHQAAAQWCHDERGVPVRPSTVKRAVESGQLAVAIVAGRRCFSAADLDTWLLSGRREASA